MNPVRFIENKSILLCGNNGGDAGSAWRKWEETSVGHPELKCGLPYDAHSNPGAFEVRFYPSGGEYVFVGTQMSQTEPESKWHYIQIPETIYVVFDIDCKIDQGPQFAGLNEWLHNNKEKYKRFTWDANGKISPAEFVICVYDHTNKFAKEQIMEMWVSLVEVNE